MTNSRNFLHVTKQVMLSFFENCNNDLENYEDMSLQKKNYDDIRFCRVLYMYSFSCARLEVFEILPSYCYLIVF